MKKNLSLRGSLIFWIRLTFANHHQKGEPETDMVHTILPMTIPEPNYDETKVPPYTLPDGLVCSDGTTVRNASDW